jgi:hypothetical protein
LTALHNILSLKGTLHVLKPLLVNRLEKFSFSGHVLGNITAGENKDKVGPKSLDLQPLFNDISNVGQECNLVCDFWFEGGDVLDSVELIKGT